MVHPHRAFGAAFGHHAQQVQLGAGLLQPLHGGVHPRPGAPARRIDAELVVQGLVAVQRHPHQKPVLGKKLRPLVVDVQAVGLDGPVDGMCRVFWRRVSSTKKAEKVQPRHRRLAALEGKTDAAVEIDGGQRLADQQAGGVPGHHAHAGHGAVGGLVLVKAIAAAHVAQTGGRFYEKIDKLHGMLQTSAAHPGSRPDVRDKKRLSDIIRRKGVFRKAKPAAVRGLTDPRRQDRRVKAVARR